MKINSYERRTIVAGLSCSSAERTYDQLNTCIHGLVFDVRLNCFLNVTLHG